jgi:hypothetical protein
MLDSLIMRLLSMGERYELPAVVMTIDELQTLQKLPQLMPLVTEGRKSLRVVLGFQGRSQIKALYGEEAEAIFSAAYTKFMLRTSEPDAARWLSDTVGEVEIERLRESRPADLMTKSGHSFSNEQKIERLLLPSEFSGLDDLHGYLKYGNHIVKFTLPIMPRVVRAPGFVPRAPQPIAKKPLPNLEEVIAQKKAAEEQKRQAEQAKRKEAIATVINGAPKAEGKAGTPPVLKPEKPEAKGEAKPDLPKVVSQDSEAAAVNA